MSRDHPTQKIEATGYEVPCRVYDPWIPVLQGAGISPVAFFESLGLDYEWVKNYDNQVSWSTWIASVEVLEERLGGKGSFERHFRLGNTLSNLDSTRILQKFAGLFTSPKFMFRVLWRWFGPSMFPGIESNFITVEDQRLVGEIIVPEGWEVSPAFFRLNRAMMIDVPILVGSGPALIELEVEERRGVFEIHLPPSASIWNRLKRAAKTTFFEDTVLDELEAQNAALVRSYRKLEEKRAELARSAENFRALTERSTEAIAVVRDDELVYANPAMAEFLNYDTVDRLLEQRLEDIVVDGATDHLLAPADRPEATQFDLHDDVRFETQDGSVVRGDVNRVEIDFEGQPSLMLISRDVTERRNLAARMMQMDRMIAVGTLAAGVAHEINNPLTYVVTNTDFSRSLLDRIRGNLDALELPSSDTLEELQRDLELIDESLADAQHGGQRVTSIVRDLRTFSRSSSKPDTATHVNEVVANAIKMGWHELRDTVEIAQNYESNQPARVDASRLSQIVLNILINAAHAVEASERPDKTVRIHTWDQDDEVCIEVRDTGVGIPPDIVDRIFDPFFTTKPVGKGTGLGLSICKNLLDDMGGELSVSSRVGEGTTVTITVPAAEPDLGLDMESSVVVEPSAFAGHSMLVIDDDPLVGESITRMLRGECDITIFQHGSEALDYLDVQSADLLLCDIMMDEMDGPTVLEAIKNRHEHLVDRFVFMSGGSFSAPEVKRLEELGRPVVSKPFTLTELHDAFDDAL
jgi:PAS domain S-box-containing protein